MSRLLDNSPEFRDPLIAKNTFNINDNYEAGHPNALSDGDEQGKGETNTVGSATDIQQRQILKAKNLYTRNAPYDAASA